MICKTNCNLTNHWVLIVARMLKLLEISGNFIIADFLRIFMVANCLLHLMFLPMKVSSFFVLARCRMALAIFCMLLAGCCNSGGKAASASAGDATTTTTADDDVSLMYAKQVSDMALERKIPLIQVAYKTPHEYVAFETAQYDLQRILD